LEDEELEKIQRRKLMEMMKRRSSEAKEPSPSNGITAGILTLTDENFAETIKRYRLTVVDFWAPWCGPCRFVSPIIEQLANQYSGEVAFCKLNVDENPVVSNSYQIQGIPTIIFFSYGNVVDYIVGAVPKSVIESRLKLHLGNATTPYS
jgi:thioredoxin 1